jgi:hypothetical protein
MIFSKTALSLLCALLLFAIFVANFLNIIAINHSFSENQRKGENFTKYLAGKYGRITESKENLIWFLQVSNKSNWIYTNKLALFNCLDLSCIIPVNNTLFLYGVFKVQYPYPYIHTPLLF